MLFDVIDETVEFDKDYVQGVIEGKFAPPERYKLEGDRIIPKTEEEILADDWNDSVERRCEYLDFLEEKIEYMESFLTETDWYVSRYSETGKEIPSDVLEKRISYRDKISEYRKTLEVARKEIPEPEPFIPEPEPEPVTEKRREDETNE